MADIEEIPLDQTENTENNQEIIQDNEELVENIEEETPAAKKKGRPPGAKNKPKPPALKPKPKPKAKVKKQPEYEEYESEEEEPPPPRRRQPAEVDRHQLAAEVLGLLQQQRYNQTTARRSHYASWFANM